MTPGWCLPVSELYLMGCYISARKTSIMPTGKRQTGHCCVTGMGCGYFTESLRALDLPGPTMFLPHVSTSKLSPATCWSLGLGGGGGKGEPGPNQGCSLSCYVTLGKPLCLCPLVPHLSHGEALTLPMRRGGCRPRLEPRARSRAHSSGPFLG